MSALSRKAHVRGLTMVIALEGWDAAGKGGVIRRLSRAMDARYYQLVPISAPTEEEKAHHYLWRFTDFEEQLVEHGVVLFKFWLHIDPDEQLRRFREREQTGYKKYKITDDDYRNRQKRPAYEAAAEEMIARTSTERAPWHLIPANDKRFARNQVLKTVCRRLAKAVG